MCGIDWAPGNVGKLGAGMAPVCSGGSMPAWPGGGMRGGGTEACMPG